MRRGAGLADFHTHSLLSDGELTPIELLRRAKAAGYRALAIADHCGLAALPRLLEELSADCALAREQWGIEAIPAVELTHLPPSSIAPAARRAKELGAWLVIVHGETPVEPVPSGTNQAALECPEVDILAHPGLLTPREAALAAQNGVFLELTARRGHCLTNGWVALLARRSGARLLVCSDAHSPEDQLTPRLAQIVARGAGLSTREWKTLAENAQLLLAKLKRLRPAGPP